MARKGGKDRGVFERPKGSGIWWTEYYDENGRRHREKAGPKSLALDLYRKRKTAVKEAEFFPELVAKRRRAELLFSTVMQDYLDVALKQHRSPTHTRIYGQRWIEYFKDRTLESITGEEIDKWMARTLAKGLKPATVNRALVVLKRCINLAVRDGKLKVNPFAQGRVKRLVENNAVDRQLSEEEEERLERVFPPEHWTIVLVAIYAGPRMSELFSMEWSWVDLANKVLTVPRSKHGKKRRVRLSADLVEALSTLPSRGVSKYVFPSETGKTPMNTSNFRKRVFNPALKAAGIENFTFHCLRHTFGSRLVMAGVPLSTVQELMGHKTITMTQRYAHLAPAHLQDAVERIARRRPTAPDAVTATETATSF